MWCARTRMHAVLVIAAAILLAPKTVAIGVASAEGDGGTVSAGRREQSQDARPRQLFAVYTHSGGHCSRSSTVATMQATSTTCCSGSVRCDATHPIPTVCTPACAKVFSSFYSQCKSQLFEQMPSLAEQRDSLDRLYTSCRNHKRTGSPASQAPTAPSTAPTQVPTKKGETWAPTAAPTTDSPTTIKTQTWTVADTNTSLDPNAAKLLGSSLYGSKSSRTGCASYIHHGSSSIEHFHGYNYSEGCAWSVVCPADTVVEMHVHSLDTKENLDWLILHDVTC